MILQYIIILATAVIAVVLQTTVLRFATEVMQVDLLFVLVVILGIFKGPVHGAILSCMIGYLQDLFFPAGVTGMFMTARMSVFLAGQSLRLRLSPDTSLSQFTIALGLGAFDRILLAILQGVFSDPGAFSLKTVFLLVLGTIINALLVPALFFLFRLIPGFMATPRGPQFLE
jgi:rod shape-determining protein MreD